MVEVSYHRIKAVELTQYSKCNYRETPAQCLLLLTSKAFIVFSDNNLNF